MKNYLVVDNWYSETEKLNVMKESVHTLFDKASYTIYRILRVLPNNMFKTGWSAYNNYKEIMTLYVYIMHTQFKVPIEDVASCLNIKTPTCNVYRNNLDKNLMKLKYPNIQTYFKEYDSAKKKVFK